MLQYSTHPTQTLSEIEVFSGNILGKNGGAQSKRQREFSSTMKDKYERDVAYTILWITQGGGEEDGKEGATAGALERSIACLYVACHHRGRERIGRRKVGEALMSFAWVAASVCLKELEKLPGNPTWL